MMTKTKKLVRCAYGYVGLCLSFTDEKPDSSLLSCVENAKNVSYQNNQRFPFILENYSCKYKFQSEDSKSLSGMKILSCKNGINLDIRRKSFVFVGALLAFSRGYLFLAPQESGYTLVMTSLVEVDI